ncbi:MAG: SDR family NAD(P)-dependent oxidoreductase [Salinivirgaceae bacterium]|nr:SDR family NAD(P)-dependent oxidoreductase [Salinivirgaceae bacterium]
MESYIFSGIGHAAGKYPVSNEFIADALRKGLLRGFDENRMAKSKNYLTYKEKNPEIGPFDYFVREKMGFNIRRHVTPFPPTKKKLYYAESSLELGVKAVDNALKDAGITPKEIDAWFVSTVSPHQKAPGIAAAIKSHFVDFTNFKPTFSLTSGCSGFNINLERATEYFKTHPEAKHLVVSHTETMSSFLTQRVKFVPFVTFADGAAAVILSRVETDKPQGVLAINNHQDMQMIDFVGVDKYWNLYMDDSLIKDRATENIPLASYEALEKTTWKVDELDLCVPHQTGNAILIPAAQKLGLHPKQLFLEAQQAYGNISGATVPIAYSMLNEQGKLNPGMKILSPVAGVGGNYGAFTYLVPDSEWKKKKLDYLFEDDLKGKTALVLGASGTLGFEIAKDLLKRGANLILHYNRNQSVLSEIENLAKEKGQKISTYPCDFHNSEELSIFIQKLKTEANEINYFVNAAGVLLSRNKGKVGNVNHYVPLQIFKTVFPKLKGSALFVGAAAEDINVPEIHEFISAKRSLHGVMASMSGEMLKGKNNLLWYIPGILEDGMLKNIDQKALYKFAVEIGQEKHLSVKETAFRIVSSLYIPKVEGTHHDYENAMVVRRDGYQLEVDI